MGLRRYTTAVIAVVVAAGVLTGCHSKAHTPATAPGAALRDGLVVARDTRVAGTVFDLPDEPSQPGRHGWRAILEIDRDPLGVYDAYVAQARKLGAPLPGSGTDRCRPLSTSTTVTTQGCTPSPTCYVAQAMLQCGGSAVTTTGPPLGIAVSLLWGRSTRHLLLEVSRDPAPDDRRFGTDRLTLTTPLPAAHAPAPATIVGQPFGETNNAFESGYRRFALVAGSRVVSDARRLGTVVLEVTGDARNVLVKYTRQIATPKTAPYVHTVHRAGGGTILSFAYSPDGGGAATFTTDASHRFVEVTYSSD